MLSNMVTETANNPGTSTINLIGAATGRVTFSSKFTSGTQCYYWISDGTQFEYGIGTSTSGAPNTLSRDTVLGNSAGTTSKLNFSGSVTVWNEVPAELTFGYSTRARIDPTSGYVGFGTAAPASHVHISGDGVANGNNAGLRITDTGASGRSVLLYTSGGTLHLQDVTSATDFWSISATGAMTVRGTIAGGGDLKIAGDTYIGGTNVNPAAAAVNGWTIGGGGNASAFSTTATTLFIGGGTTGLIAFANGSGSLVGSITTNGSSVAYNTTSDYRMKDDHGQFTDSGSVIDAVPVHLAAYKASPTDLRAMFLAHELQAQAPYAVHGVKDAVDEQDVPVPQQVDHSALIPVMWAEIQALRARLTAHGIT
jgi:hypothetical protein